MKFSVVKDVARSWRGPDVRELKIEGSDGASPSGVVVGTVQCEFLLVGIRKGIQPVKHRTKSP